jgi:hypothetical protein
MLPEQIINSDLHIQTLETMEKRLSKRRHEEMLLKFSFNTTARDHKDV